MDGTHAAMATVRRLDDAASGANACVASSEEHGGRMMNTFDKIIWTIILLSGVLSPFLTAATGNLNYLAGTALAFILFTFEMVWRY